MLRRELELEANYNFQELSLIQMVVVSFNMCEMVLIQVELEKEFGYGMQRLVEHLVVVLN